MPVFAPRSLHRAAALLGIAVVALGLAGCGSSGGGSSVGSGTSAIDSGDQARADAAVLVQADFPAAFHRRAVPPSTGRCVDQAGLTVTGSAESDQYIRDDAAYGMLGQSKTLVLQSDAQAKTLFSRSQDPDAIDCLGRHVASTSKASEFSWHFDGAERVDGPRAGDESFTTRFRYTVKSGGQTGRFIEDFTVVRVGNAVSAVALVNLGEPFDDTSSLFGGPTGDDLVGAVAFRMQTS